MAQAASTVSVRGLRVRSNCGMPPLRLEPPVGSRSLFDRVSAKVGVAGARPVGCRGAGACVRKHTAPLVSEWRGE